MNLIIDIGNTKIKVALFKGDSIYWNGFLAPKEILIGLEKIAKRHKIDQGIIASVRVISENELLEIAQLFPILQLNSTTKLPFQNEYSTSNTLGVDRLAVIASAVHKYPNQNVLVIDAGTCITYDFIGADKIYRGGAISPGLTMRYKAMHTFTEKLPLLSPKKTNGLIGNSTEDSMHSGVVNGVIAEIIGIIDAYKLEYEKLTPILTGGDTYFLAKRLKNGIFATPNFLLEGLNTILTYNSKND